MTSTSAVLGQIDRTLRDSTVSGDAMRWTPEGGKQPEPSGPPAPWHDLRGAVIVFEVNVDTAEFTRALNGLAAAVTRTFLPVVSDTVKGFHALSAALSPGLHRRCVTCRPARVPKPLAVDGREYQRRLAARRRRRR